MQVIIEEKEFADESWTKNDSLVARAVFDNAQSWSGWMYLEIVTKEAAFVDLQVFKALFLDAFSVVFRTLLHVSTMSQAIVDIHSYSQIFSVMKGMSF